MTTNSPPLDVDAVSFDSEGLVPAIVQDAASGEVLMLGYMNRESLEQTLSEGLVTFWSRSRGELWRKGDSSGNRLELRHIAADCDGDTLLVEAAATGPTCHTGTVSCFADNESQGFRRLEDLWRVIAQRATDKPDGSYTAQLIAAGVDATGRKVTEEATEVLLAAKDHAAGIDPEHLAEEAADLIYHLLVVLAERGESPTAFLDALERRA
ncbi:MAG: bifunctional phosphoribosyl-AMP cyclohydrolase/phosphoribosyl-ATP diphosphatase HisIE [Acidimicrobiia bacterium]|nr:bifunctional phosphoribosyl-AMP cyclohydrolase/phosphoribosyl-ATP diphosphatase HisIE [Acidimicrobiia bacterium]